MENNVLVRTAGPILALAVLVALGGCSLFTSTTDGIAAGFGSTTDASGSTTPDSKSARGVQAEAFVRERFEAIRFEAARGGGENIDALAMLLGESDRAQFGRWMKQNYAGLFRDLEQPVELLVRIEARRARSG